MNNALRLVGLAALLSTVSTACDSSAPELATGSASDPVQIVNDCDDLPTDAIEINEGSITGDVLTLSVSYGGGCREHAFAVCWGGLFLESLPVQVTLGLHHDDGGDACEAYLTRDIEIDLSSLRQSYETTYGPTSGTIRLRLADAPRPWTYEW